ncbi:hypothetical protein HYALB_00011038 [Hymenoscyphus albidus]|uniref:Uncharacterized protein n=1 Tax=Hymenoscyphus albidus TaxID=595503 RepID=A0A9N9LXG9_9HELO|nr:hypothetical protein HYALB_00011038 [Hymenoscyphus albidus]
MLDRNRRSSKENVNYSTQQSVRTEEDTKANIWPTIKDRVWLGMLGPDFTAHAVKPHGIYQILKFERKEPLPGKTNMGEQTEQADRFRFVLSECRHYLCMASTLFPNSRTFVNNPSNGCPATKTLISEEMGSRLCLYQRHQARSAIA